MTTSDIGAAPYDYAAPDADTGPEVDTRSGRVRGVEHEGTAVFRSIPFAAPPVGDLRFAPPAPAVPWEGVREAVTAGPIAPQNPSMLERMLGAGDPVIDEADCLSLNVFTPGCDDAARPVLVWIHGGGFLTGTGSIPWYDGTRLAERGVVVVTVNYRLGVLGFLHLEGVADGFEGSGNAGILDQVAALAWVRDNVRAFGGDPADVTVFGESAGAMSVATLLAVPAAAGLFRRAILQSGAGSHVHSADAATEAARAFMVEVGVDPADPVALRGVPLGELLEAQARFTAAMPFERGLPLQPVIDGTVLPGLPVDEVAGGSAAGVELLVGTNADEMKMFLLMEPAMGQLDEATLSARADAFFTPGGAEPGEGLAAYRQSRPDAPVGDVLSDLLTDHTFRIPAVRLAEAQAATGATVRMYVFGYRTPAFGGALGACHALEIPFAWDNLDAEGAAVFAGPPTDATRTLARRMADAWVAFAATGRPAADGLPVWPAYNTERRATMWFDVDRIEVVDDPGGAERELWARTASTP